MNKKSDILKAFYHHFNALKFKSEAAGEYYSIYYQLTNEKNKTNFISKAIIEDIKSDINYESVIISDVDIYQHNNKFFINIEYKYQDALYKIEIKEDFADFKPEKHSNPCDHIIIESFIYQRLS